MLIGSSNCLVEHFAGKVIANRTKKLFYNTISAFNQLCLNLGSVLSSNRMLQCQYYMQTKFRHYIICSVCAKRILTCVLIHLNCMLG